MAVVSKSLSDGQLQLKLKYPSLTMHVLNSDLSDNSGNVGWILHFHQTHTQEAYCQYRPNRNGFYSSELPQLKELFVNDLETYDCSFYLTGWRSRTSRYSFHENEGSLRFSKSHGSFSVAAREILQGTSN